MVHRGRRPQSRRPAHLAKQRWKVCYIEVALDYVFIEPGLAERLHDFHDRHFVDPRRPRRQNKFWVEVNEETGARTSYTAQGRFVFAWYSDKPRRAPARRSASTVRRVAGTLAQARTTSASTRPPTHRLLGPRGALRRH
jgi:hypothetical protein